MPRHENIATRDGVDSTLQRNKSLRFLLFNTIEPVRSRFYDRPSKQDNRDKIAKQFFERKQDHRVTKTSRLTVRDADPYLDYARAVQTKSFVRCYKFARARAESRLRTGTGRESRAIARSNLIPAAGVCCLATIFGQLPLTPSAPTPPKLNYTTDTDVVSNQPRLLGEHSLIQIASHSLFIYFMYRLSRRYVYIGRLMIRAPTSCANRAH